MKRRIKRKKAKQFLGAEYEFESLETRKPNKRARTYDADEDRLFNRV